MAGNKGLLPASIDDPFWQQDVAITMPLYLVGRLNDLVMAFMSNPSTQAAAWQLVQARAGGQIPPIIFNKNMIEIQLLLAISLEGPVNEKVKETEALQEAALAGTEPQTEVITKHEFRDFTPYQKGYAVYMFGCRKDQPNVPKVFKPLAKNVEEYTRGESAAVMEAQDSEE